MLKSEGTLAKRPTNPLEGDEYNASDTKQLFICHVSGIWDEIRTGIPTKELTTIDDTPVNIFTIAVPDDTVIQILADITARRTNGANRAGYVRLAVVYREGGGPATLEGAAFPVFTRESNGLWGAKIDVNGDNLQVEVQGAAGETVNWIAMVRVQQVS